MRNRIFVISFYLAAIILILPNIFTFCSATRYEEKPPSFSNTKMSDWQKLRTDDIETVIKKLDSLLTPDAKNYYASLDEPYAALIMQRSFANAISQSWNIEEGEFDFAKRNYKSGFLDLFSTNGYPYQEIKSKVVSICYYRHLQNRSYDFRFIKDSLKKAYPLKKDKFNIYFDYEVYNAEEDSISNNFYAKTWQVGDEVRQGFYYEGVKLSKTISGYFTGTIIAKDIPAGMIETRITSIEANNKKVLAFIDPKTKVEIFAIGKTIRQKPANFTNTSRKEPFRY